MSAATVFLSPMNTPSKPLLQPGISQWVDKREETSFHSPINEAYSHKISPASFHQAGGPAVFMLPPPPPPPPRRITPTQRAIRIRTRDWNAFPWRALRPTDSTYRPPSSFIRKQRGVIPQAPSFPPLFGRRKWSRGPYSKQLRHRSKYWGQRTENGWTNWNRMFFQRCIYGIERNQALALKSICCQPTSGQHFHGSSGTPVYPNTIPPAPYNLNNQLVNHPGTQSTISQQLAKWRAKRQQSKLARQSSIGQQPAVTPAYAPVNYGPSPGFGANDSLNQPTYSVPAYPQSQQGSLAQQQAFAPQGTFAPQQGTFAPQQGTFAPQQGTFAPQQGSLAQQQAFAPQGTIAPQQGTLAPQQGTLAPQQTFLPQQQGVFSQQSGTQVPYTQPQQFKQEETRMETSLGQAAF